MEYDLDLQKVKEQIIKENAKRVLIQLPDGLKPEAKKIQQELKDTGAKLIFWAGSNYGACDLPQGIEKFKIDLLIHFGHSSWKK